MIFFSKLNDIFEKNGMIFLKKWYDIFEKKKWHGNFEKCCDIFSYVIALEFWKNDLAFCENIDN